MKQRYSTWAVCVCGALAAALLLLSALIPETPAEETQRRPQKAVSIEAIDPVVEPVEEVAEENENENIEAALISKATKLENVTVTHYCICKKCCGKSPDDPAYGITASGVQATPYVSVAVDPDVIPLGSDVLVDYGDGEIHYYRADDTGSAVGNLHIDLCVASHQEALNLGVKSATVYWVAQQ